MVSKRYARAPFNHTKHHLVHGVLAELVREVRHLLKDVAIKATPIDFLLPTLLKVLARSPSHHACGQSRGDGRSEKGAFLALSLS